MEIITIFVISDKKLELYEITFDGDDQFDEPEFRNHIMVNSEYFLLVLM